MTIAQGASPQVQMIRQIQVEDGQTPCYATPDAANCTKQSECTWRHDCYEEAHYSDETHGIAQHTLQNT